MHSLKFSPNFVLSQYLPENLSKLLKILNKKKKHACKYSEIYIFIFWKKNKIFDTVQDKRIKGILHNLLSEVIDDNLFQCTILFSC